VCDRVAIINEGELKAVGSVNQIVAEHGTTLEKAFLNIIGYQPEPVV